MSESWQPQLQAFFDLRGMTIGTVPTVEDLCYVSGREPRLWTNDELQLDLKKSLLRLIEADKSSEVLEVGAGSGFLARLVAPEVKKFTGIDLSKGALAVAKKLKLPNARFQVSDGEALPFADNQFDAAYCYDVYTNFPRFDDGAPLIKEMIRVVKPGGLVLVGSIPDASVHDRFMEKVKQVSQELDERYGPARVRPDLKPVPMRQRSFGASLRSLLAKFGLSRTPSESVAQGAPEPSINPQILTYNFHQSEFETLGEQEDVSMEIHPTHSKNPYAEFRFNAVYKVPQR